MFAYKSTLKNLYRGNKNHWLAFGPTIKSSIQSQSFQKIRYTINKHHQYTTCQILSNTVSSLSVSQSSFTVTSRRFLGGHLGRLSPLVSMVYLDPIVVLGEVLDPLFWWGGVFHWDGPDLGLGNGAGWHGEVYGGELFKGFGNFIVSPELQGQFEQMWGISTC